jgi:hypothetical protein
LFLGQAEKLIEMRNDRGTDATLEEVVLALLNDKREGA